MLELPRDDEQVMLHHVELVQQADMSVGHIRDKHVLVVWKERVCALLFLSDTRDPFPLELLHEMNLESDSPLFDVLNASRDLLQSPALNGVLGCVEDGLPERSRFHRAYCRRR